MISNNMLTVLILCLSLGVTVFPFLLRGGKKNFDILDPINFIAISFFLNYPFSFLLYNSSSHAKFFHVDQYNISLVNEAFLLKIVSMIIIYFIYFCKWGTKSILKPSPPRKSLSLKRSYFIIVFYSLIAYICAYVLLTKMSGMTYHEKAISGVVGNYYLVMGILFVATSTCLFYLVSFFGGKIVRLVFVVYLFSNMCMLSLFGYRGLMLEVLIPVFIMYHYIKKKISLFIVALTLGCLSIPLVALTFIRYYGARSLADILYTFKEVGWFNVIIGQYISRQFAWESLSHIMDWIPRYFDYSRGKDFLFLFLSVIPRAFWPDKPLAPAREFTDKLFSQYFETGTSIPIPFVGNLYADFGVVGVLVGSCICGIVLKGLYSWFIKNFEGDRKYITVLIYSLILLPVVNTFTMTIMNGVVNLLIRVVPMAIALWFISVKGNGVDVTES